jgi:hypothetical protein
MAQVLGLALELVKLKPASSDELNVRNLSFHSRLLLQ